MEILGFLRSPRQIRPTDIVQPLDKDGPAADEPNEHELDWCFEDAELTRQLRAVKRGRGWMLASILASCAVLIAGISLVV